MTNIDSTVPANGDVNPYGIAVVPQSTGKLVSGDTLVSNFNNGANLQGTGTTIVQISPSGSVTTFAQIDGPLPGACPGGIGLTTALNILAGGWVVVGTLPTSDGTSATAQAGCLIVLNSAGVPVETWSGGVINGPWDSTSVSGFGGAEIFVSSVLNGTVAHSPATVDQGTVARLDIQLSPGQLPRLVRSTVIGNGFAERTDPNALVVGPTGLALGYGGQLYVADAVNSRIAMIPLGRVAVVTGFRWRLHPDLGWWTQRTARFGAGSQRGRSERERGRREHRRDHPVRPSGQTVQIDPAGAGGDLFGLTIAPLGRGVLFVDDGDNTLKLFGPGHHGH